MTVTLEAWSDADLALLWRSNTPEMTSFLGGPESDEKVLDRHSRYLRYWAEDPQTAWTFHVLVDDEVVGSVGYWRREPDDPGNDELEIGWAVVSTAQGRGIASAAVSAAIADARARGHRGKLHATPSIENGPSNGVCRRAGFTLVTQIDIEYPPGHPMAANDWVFDLGQG